jgi:glutathione peroxidase
MKPWISCLTVAALACAALSYAEEKKVPDLLQGKMKTLQGKDVDLSKYQGKVLLIVNVASKCGATPQYEQLEDLHEKYAEMGLAVIGVPCNQFGKQEPGTAKEIEDFCRETYKVQFDILEKVDVNGEKAAPLFQKLKDQAGKLGSDASGDVKWNFEKFVVSRDGKVVARFRTSDAPDKPVVVKTIEAELGKKAQ